MSFNDTVRSIRMRVTPPSSRSFKRVTERLMLQNDEMMARLDVLSRQVSELENRVAVHDMHSRLRQEFLFRKDGESSKDSNRRFFASIPAASGAKRLMQLANAKIMEALHEICTANNIDYWFAYGTLVATLSRHGFIPWDDDIDLCMMRDDAFKLYQLMKKNDRYQITLVYDWMGVCKQYRFSMKDSSIPCFVDISIYDWATDALRSHDDEIRALRLKLMDEVHSSIRVFSYWKDRLWLFAPDSGFVVQTSDVDLRTQDPSLTFEQVEIIERIFSKYQQEAIEKGILCDREDATAVAYAIDNTYDAPWRRILWPMDMIFPIRACDFETYHFYIPNDAESVANECYPGWPYLPSDILSHDHISGALLDQPEVLESMRTYLEQ